MAAHRASRYPAILITVACTLLMSTLVQSQQLSSSGTVAIKAIVRGYVSVSVTSTPVSVGVLPDGSTQSQAAVPVVVRWNVNPSEVQGFEVIGYFSDPAMALVHDEGGVVVSSDQVLGRFDSGPFRPFNSTTPIGPAGGSVVLFSETVFPGRARGQRGGLIELRIADQSVPELPPGEYRGVLNVEIRHY